ncbi:Hint domain-containing protein [Frigidibacter sp. MR17.14]|uniref:Hint domain-containing protein n=1 Tax=Frigidibacter sp. MR17.14 TaxID=3126509 RepID=UPI003012E9BC
MTDAGGTFVIPWQQTEIDGLRAAGPEALALGAVWRWDGPAVRIEGGPGPLLLGLRDDQDRLRAVASRKAQRLLRATGHSAPAAPPDEDGLAMAPANGFLVTDGHATWRVLLLHPACGRRGAPLVFDGLCPPRVTELWIIDLRLQRAPPEPAAPLQGLASGTMLLTPEGPRPVEALGPGDRVITRDAGAQRVLWTGARRLGPGRLAALPAEAPVQLAADLPGIGCRAPLLLAPGQGVALGGPTVAALFGARAVLALAGTLTAQPGIGRVHPRDGVTCHWLMLPDRHLMMLAAGGAVQAFDPQTAAPHLTPDEHEAIAVCRADAFLAESAAAAAPGLRRLTPGEAVLLGAPAARAAAHAGLSAPAARRA